MTLNSMQIITLEIHHISNFIQHLQCIHGQEDKQSNLKDIYNESGHFNIISLCMTIWNLMWLKIL